MAELFYNEKLRSKKALTFILSVSFVADFVICYASLQLAGQSVYLIGDDSKESTMISAAKLLLLNSDNTATDLIKILLGSMLIAGIGTIITYHMWKKHISSKSG